MTPNIGEYDRRSQLAFFVAVGIVIAYGGSGMYLSYLAVTSMDILLALVLAPLGAVMTSMSIGAFVGMYTFDPEEEPPEEGPKLNNSDQTTATKHES